MNLSLNKIIAFLCIFIISTLNCHSRQQTIPPEQAMVMMNEIDCDQLSDEQLKEIIMGVCEDFQAEDIINAFGMPVMQCYHAFLHDKPIDRMVLTNCAENILMQAKGQNKLGCQILKKVCDILQKIDEQTETLCDKFEQTWTIFVCQTVQPISGPTTISQPGSYCLTQDIMGTVTIAADRVFLNLNEKTISGGTNGIEVSNQEDVFIRNGIIKNMKTDGILIDTCTNVTISDIEFIASAAGITVLTTTCVRIEHCTFREHTSDTICLDNTNNGQIIGNKAINNTGVGIVLNSSVENMIAQNTCNNNNNGIFLSSSSNNTLLENICNNNGNDGINLFSSSNNNTLSKNTCNDNGLSGIDLSSSDNNTLSENACNNNSTDGIRLASSDDNIISKNMCNKNTDDGINISNAASLSNTVVFNSTNENSDTGIKNNGTSTSAFNNSSVDNATANYGGAPGITNVCTPTDLLTTVSCGANFSSG